MPLYSFHCKSCEQIFSRIVTPGKTESLCPQCGTEVSKDLPKSVLVASPTTDGRKFDKYMKGKSKSNKSKWGIK